MKLYKFSTSHIVFGNKARQRLLQGVSEVKKAGVLTLGPQGRNVVIESETGNHRSTKDGVTVVKNVMMSDRLSEMGAAMIRQSSSQTNKFAGDGTTTSALIAANIFEMGQAYVSAGHNPIYITRGLKEAKNRVLEYLEEIKTTEIDDQLLYNVAKVSSNYDENLTNIVFKAIKEIGINGIVTIEPGGTESVIQIQQGIQILRGFMHEKFADKGTIKCILHYPFILTSKEPILQIKQILPILELVKNTNSPLFIMASDISEEVMSQLLYNHTKDIIKVCAITIPGMGQSFSNDLIDDFSILCNSQSVENVEGVKQLSQLGRAVKIEVSNTETMIIGTQPDEQEVENRKNFLKNQMENANNYSAQTLKDRLTRFDGRTAIVYIGGKSEIEMHENRDKLVDSLNATKSTLKNGVLPGGGTALLHASKLLDYLQIDPEYQLGVSLLQETLRQPIKQLCRNAGINDGQIVKVLLEEGDYNVGFDQRRACLGNMIDLGVIDSFAVVKHSLLDGVSLGSMLLSTEAAIVLDKNYTPTALNKYKKEAF
ncbi:unnamed protein product (macronuclear) [Paramecium tetraurelia]|uniref:Uncharacterized protein n=1 Tax=Paramecium tetraurelia TaxID=5888 RepID=A0C3G4_PARTE|nr:uncharacterized protein GSPATT00034810001 [Paramecium tetraurelia]CAK65331.1 unnamed protein product [Paramecium tetraurelia]|eukprot:XP_001432728.1 hypothetical protein (macronuclear) [Paramecium tetraurelia strain d4-2]